jgi:peptide/nickel transport system substrate-binding protein
MSGVLLGAACSTGEPCPRCDTVVVAATGEPASLLPPLVEETVGRDISDQVFERLADLRPGAAPVDTAAYAPRLASRWERLDSLTLRFHLRSHARWQDGDQVTAHDVVFSFNAFSDPKLETETGDLLRNTLHAEAEDSTTLVVHFQRAYPEQLYDATYHVRVIPAHIWESRRVETWAADTALDHLIGSGAYRVTKWEHGQSVVLQADTSESILPRIRRVVWRFAPDPDAALNAVLSHEADILETVGAPERVARVLGDSTLVAMKYPSAAYGFVGYRLWSSEVKPPSGKRPAAPPVPHPILGDRAVRRALNMAVDRVGIARAIFGPDTKAPPGPMSQLLWIWDDGIQALPFDTAAAARELDKAGWFRGADGMRHRRGRKLAFDILVPATSVTRKSAAEALQEAWRLVGVDASVTAVEFPVFQQRLGTGKFDAYIGAYLDEPSPRGLADQWTTAGIGLLNYGGYRSAAFDALFEKAELAGTVRDARASWREAMDTINADAPALFLYAPTNVAAVSKRLRGVRIDPYSWASGLTGWEVAGEK